MNDNGKLTEEVLANRARAMGYTWQRGTEFKYEAVKPDENTTVRTNNLKMMDWLLNLCALP